MSPEPKEISRGCYPAAPALPVEEGKQIMRSTRHLPADLRRARLLAAREYVAGSICWRGILSGHWDGGTVVRKYMTDKGN